MFVNSIRVTKCNIAIQEYRVYTIYEVMDNLYPHNKSQNRKHRGSFYKARKGGVKCQEEMGLDQLEVDCVTDPAGKQAGEVSKADKKVKVPRPEVKKADARNKMCRLDHSGVECGC